MRATEHAVAARCVFDGMELRENAAVVIDGARIVTIVPRADVPFSLPVHDLPESVWLVPGFIDIQVNGGGDVLFNDQPTPDAIRTIVAAHRQFGTTALLPTLISDSAAKMRAAIAGAEAPVAVARAPEAKVESKPKSEPEAGAQKPPASTPKAAE